MSTTNNLYLLTAVFPNGSAPLRIEQSRDVAIEVAQNLASNVTMLITNYDTIGNYLAMDTLLSIDVYEFAGGKAKAIVWREHASDLCERQDDDCVEQEQTQ